MPIRRRSLVLTAGAAVVLAPLAAREAAAQKLPAGKPVRLVVPYAAGGTTDVVARLLAQRLAEVLGHAVVVENRPGGGGTIAGAQVIGAPADGLTLLLGGLEIATAPALVPAKTFLATRDLVGVAGLTLGPLVLVVSPRLAGARTVQELIETARREPGSLTFASAGIGNVTHLFGEVFKRAARIDIRHVPYRGAAPALTDLQAGTVSMMFAGTASVRPLVASGNLRALAVTGRDPAAAGVPDVPTFAQAGFAMPETDAGAWLGLFAARDTPRDVVVYLYEAVGRVLTLPETQAQLRQNGLTPQPMAPDELTAHLAAQTRAWGQLITEVGISI